MQCWAAAAAVALLWPQLTLFSCAGARREPKRPRQLDQRTESPNTTVSNSEGLPGSAKVCTGPAVRLY